MPTPQQCESYINNTYKVNFHKFMKKLLKLQVPTEKHHSPNNLLEEIYTKNHELTNMHNSIPKTNIYHRNT